MSVGAILLAAAVVTAPVPTPRPGAAATPAGQADAPAAVPETQRALNQAVNEALEQVLSPAPVLDLGMPKPPPRPAGLAAAAAAQAASPQPAPDLRLDQMVCRDPRLKGKPRANVVGHLSGCVIVNPVNVTEVAGIKLSQAATLDCRTARAFANWITGVAAPAARDILGRRLVKVTIYGSYSCRTRNNRPGARLSEHAVGRAVDVAGVVLGDGRKISVLKDWGKGHAGKFLRRVWKQACGPFKTVIGPEGDRFHRDHLHLDTAFRNRGYCQ